MNKRLRIKTVLTAWVAVLLTAVSSFAALATVEFTWEQTSPTVGSGMLTTTVIGFEFSAPMPFPTFTQDDTLLPGEVFPATGPSGSSSGTPGAGTVGTVGFANTANSANPGPAIPTGFFIGWGGQTVNLTATIGATDFTFPVTMVFGSSDRTDWSATAFDDPVNATDLVGGDPAGENRWVGWVGDNLDGHRRSGDNNQFYDVGQQSFTTDGGGSGGNAGGDDIGFRMGLRDSSGGSAFLGDVMLSGRIQQDESGISPNLIVPGDVNIDLVVNLADFEPIRLNFGQAVAARTDGDLNADGIVNFVDFNEFETAFLAGGGSLAALHGSVPEPSTAVLVIMLMAVGSLRRRYARSTPV